MTSKVSWFALPESQRAVATDALRALAIGARAEARALRARANSSNSAERVDPDAPGSFGPMRWVVSPSETERWMNLALEADLRATALEALIDVGAPPVGAVKWTVVLSDAGRPAPLLGIDPNDDTMALFKTYDEAVAAGRQQPLGDAQHFNVFPWLIGA